MSIIDTSGWMNAALAGQRARLADEDQQMQRDNTAFQRERIRRQDEQDRNDQRLYGALWDAIAGNQPGTSTPPTDYTMGPPTLQQQQQQAAQPSQFGFDPNIRNLVTQASPQAASRFVDDAYRIRRENFLREEKQRQAQTVAQRYAPLIDEFSDPEDRSDFRVALEDVAAGDKPTEHLYEVLNNLRQKKQGRFDAGVMAGYDPSGQSMGPPMDLSRASPNVVRQIQGWNQQRDMLGQRQDNALELRGLDQQNRYGTIDYKAKVAAQAKELTPQEFEQQVKDVMTSNPRSGRAEAEAYVRGRHDGLFNQIQPNISGATRNGGLTQAQKDEESALKIEIDARERQLNRLTDQIKTETDAGRKAELLSEADFANRYIAKLENQLTSMVRSRSTVPNVAPNSNVPQSVAPVAPVQQKQPATAAPVSPSGITQADMNQADSELPNGTDEQVIARAREIAAQRSGR